MSDYRVKVTIRNNRLLSAIEDAGFVPGQAFSKACGLSYSQINDLINMKASCVDGSGKIRPCVQKLCDFLNKIPMDLFSDTQFYGLIESNACTLNMDEIQVQNIMVSAESRLEVRELTEVVNGSLRSLNMNESQVLQLRYFKEKTLEECAQEIGVTREKIRQIEAMAFRKLRKGKHGNALKEILDVQHNREENHEFQ